MISLDCRVVGHRFQGVTKLAYCGYAFVCSGTYRLAESKPICSRCGTVQEETYPDVRRYNAMIPC